MRQIQVGVPPTPIAMVAAVAGIYRTFKSSGAEQDKRMNQGDVSLGDLRIDRDDEGGALARGWGWAVWIAVAVGGVAIAIWWSVGQPIELKTMAVSESVAAGERRSVLDASGYVVARLQTTVSSKITGKVMEVLFEEGMRVDAGQVLARLDDSNARASLELAEAEVASARSALAETHVRLIEAEKQLSRTTRLTSDKVVSAAELDTAEAEAKSLQARLERQTAECTVAERQVAVWKRQVEDTVVRAPFAGVAVSKDAQPGEMISPVSAGGGFTRTGIGTIVDMGSLEIEVDVNESYIKRVRSGQEVEASLDAYPDWKIPCKVIAIIPTADRQKASVKVRIGFDKLDPRILPEMGVKVAFLEAEGGAGAKAGVLIPRSALFRKDGRDTVWLVSGGRLEARTVAVGMFGTDGASVIEGLALGDVIVLDGALDLVPGKRVRQVAP